MKINDYKDLRIWQNGINIVDKVYDLTESFPNKEMYGLCSQMRRAAVSIPSNVAEGFVRQYPKEYKQFLYVSLGSCAELDTQSIIAQRRNFISANDLIAIGKDLTSESKMLVKLINLIN